jgi:hypothetical protein
MLNSHLSERRVVVQMIVEWMGASGETFGSRRVRVDRTLQLLLVHHLPFLRTRENSLIRTRYSDAWISKRPQVDAAGRPCGSAGIFTAPPPSALRTAYAAAASFFHRQSDDCACLLKAVVVIISGVDLY